MNCHEFRENYIDIFYESDDLSRAGRVHRHRILCEDCARLWQNQLTLSTALHSIPEHVPSRMALNRVLAFAGERAMLNERRGFWMSLLRPAMPVALALIAWVGYQNYQPSAVATRSESIHSDTSIQMPDTYFALEDVPVNGAIPNPHISYVSTGTQNSGQVFGNQRFAFDDELDRKKLLHNLTISDVSALFDRARKMEKLREPRQALNDYEFIAQFHPRFENIKAVKFSMARCLAALGSKNEAVSLLEEIHSADPENEDVVFWLDQLKSDTL